MSTFEPKGTDRQFEVDLTSVDHVLAGLSRAERNMVFREAFILADRKRDEYPYMAPGTWVRFADFEGLFWFACELFPHRMVVKELRLDPNRLHPKTELFLSFRSRRLQRLKPAARRGDAPSLILVIPPDARCMPLEAARVSAVRFAADFVNDVKYAATALIGDALGARLGQATRTWVSGVGDDVNPCSRTAPCKTFAGAISKTAAGGEINCLDPAGCDAILDEVTTPPFFEERSSVAGKAAWILLPFDRGGGLTHDAGMPSTAANATITAGIAVNSDTVGIEVDTGAGAGPFAMSVPDCVGDVGGEFLPAWLLQCPDELPPMARP